MSTPAIGQLEPEMMESPALLFAGLSGNFGADAANEIPHLCERFRPYLGTVPGQIGSNCYGLCFPMGKRLTYMAAVAVHSFGNVAPEFSQASMPAQTCAVFAHRESVSTIMTTYQYIWSKWLPYSSFQMRKPESGEPSFLEKYDANFDAEAGTGLIEIWIPIVA